MLTDEYLQYLEKENINEATIYSQKIFFKRIIKLGFTDEYIEKYSEEKIHNTLLSLNAKSMAVFSTMYSNMTSFLKWCAKEDIIKQEEYEHFQSVNKRELFNSNNGKHVSFISNMEYEAILSEMEKYDLNPLYLTTLYMCLYEGVYSSELYELIHLRRQDINQYDNTLKLSHKDGSNTILRVSHKLIKQLIELSKMDGWYRRNKSGEYSIKTTGMYEDSVFKIEVRGEVTAESFKHCLYRRIRNINKEYIDKKILPQDVYISGIIHRLEVDLDLEYEGIELKNYFTDSKIKKITKQILGEELKRINYNITPLNFMIKVKEIIETL